MVNFVKNWIAEDYRMLNGDCAGKPKTLLNLILMIISFPIIFVVGAVAFLFGFIKRLYQIFIGNRLQALFYGKYNCKKDRYTTIPTIRMNALDKIIFESRKDAEENLLKIYDIFEVYSVVTLKDYLELAGVDHIDPKYNSYGWKNYADISDMRVDRIRDGYIIRVSDPTYLD